MRSQSRSCVGVRPARDLAGRHPVPTGTGDEADEREELAPRGRALDDVAAERVRPIEDDDAMPAFAHALIASAIVQTNV